MTAIMCICHCDNITQKHPIGWCIIEECTKMADPIDGWYGKGKNIFWVMLREAGLWYPHGKFNTIWKAIDRMELIENGEIEPW